MNAIVCGLFYHFVSSFDRSNLLSKFEFESSLFKENYDRWIQWNRENLGQYSVFNFSETKIKIYVGVADEKRWSVQLVTQLVSFETYSSNSAAFLVQWWVRSP